MKKISLISLFGLCAFASVAQWNTSGTNIYNSNTGNVGIGTPSPGAKLSFNNLNDGTNQADGITWYNPTPLVYGIYRTAGPWSSPNYQQLKISFETGIVLDPGSSYGKSYVEIQGSGLRVTSGNVGIGTNNPSPASRLHLFNASSHTYLNIDKPGTSYEGGIQFSINGVPTFYLWSDNDGTDALRIQAVGLTGESDAAPRMQFPKLNKNIYMAESGGNVGIGTTSPNQKLTVNGTIYGKEVKVDLNVPGPDYVFEKDYKLPSLEQIKSYVDQHKHLPDVPSAKEMEQNGINLSDMNMILLKKVEELTLHLISQSEQNQELKQEVKFLKTEIENLKIRK